MSDALDIIVPILTVLIAPLVPIFYKALSKPRHAIRWATLTPIAMMDIPENVLEKFAVTFDGTKVRGLTKYSFIIHNSGRRPIDEEMIVKRLKWTGPGKIFDARVVRTSPAVELQLDYEKDQMRVGWKLFNHRCKALIEVLCESSTDPGIGRITAQIKGVSEIERPRIQYVDREQSRKEYRMNKEKMPKALQYVSFEALDLFFLRHNRQVLAILIALLCACAAYLIGFIYFGIQSEMPIAIGLAAGSSFSALFLYLLKNPYAKLLRNG